MVPFTSYEYLSETPKTAMIHCPLQRHTSKYTMNRPICPVCQQRPCAINYHSIDRVHYRSRCDYCSRKQKKLKPREPKWKQQGYKKKTSCDLCGFKARTASQILVYHIDGNLNNAEQRNLRSVCRNCIEDIKRQERPWKRGDLEPDF
jgi:hypothetical protein